MKIFCIGRNYIDHAKELNNPIPQAPVVFMKPPTALLLKGDPFYYPDFTQDLHYEGEIVLRICKNGRHIEPAFAATYFDQIAFGIDFTARDLQEAAKQKGLPWEIAKGFDGSAPLSEYLPLPGSYAEGIAFELRKNGQLVQSGNTRDMIFNFERIVCYISQFFKLQQGDLIYTGTPAGVGPVRVGDILEGYIEGKQVLTCAIK